MYAFAWHIHFKCILCYITFLGGSKIHLTQILVNFLVSFVLNACNWTLSAEKIRKSRKCSKMRKYFNNILRIYTYIYMWSPNISLRIAHHEIFIKQTPYSWINYVIMWPRCLLYWEMFLSEKFWFAVHEKEGLYWTKHRPLFHVFAEQGVTQAAYAII